MRGITAVLQLPFISIVVRFLLGFVHQCGSCRLQWDPESLMCCQMMMLILAFRMQQLSTWSFAMLAVWFRFAYGWVAAWSNEKRSIESFLFKDPLLFLKPGFPCPYTFPPLSVYICSRIDSCICFLFKCWLFPVPGPSRKARRLAWQYSRGDPWLQVLEVRRCMLDSAYIYKIDSTYPSWKCLDLEIYIEWISRPFSFSIKESCTEIINSAIADFRDAMDMRKSSSSKICPVIAELASKRHDDSVPQLHAVCVCPVGASPDQSKKGMGDATRSELTTMHLYVCYIILGWQTVFTHHSTSLTFHLGRRCIFRDPQVQNDFWCQHLSIYLWWAREFSLDTA